MADLMDECEVFDDYFLWNDALWEYYFEGVQYEEVILYVDNGIIEYIGTNNTALRNRFQELECPNYLDFFYGSILSNFDITNIQAFLFEGGDRNGNHRIEERYLSEERINSVLNAWDRRTIQTTAIMEFARALASIRRTDFNHKCPCLNYVVFLILEYGHTRTREGIERVIQGKSGLNNARVITEQFGELFNSVQDWSKDENGIPRFYAKNIRGEQEFVGLLRYHLVLNRSEQTELQDALYKYNIDWDESEIPYRNFVYNNIFPILGNKDIDNKIKKALGKVENYAFFYNLFHSFNSESYTPSYQIPKSQRGHFFLLYDREEKTFLLKTDVRAYDKSQNNQVAISYDGERECGLFGAVYLNGEIGVENYSSVRYEDERLKVIPIQRDWFFFIMSGKYFQQVLTPVKNEGCLIVTKKRIEEVKSSLNQDSINDYSDKVYLRQIFGEEYNIFYVSNWNSEILFTDNQNDDDQEANEVPAGPKLTNGILNPTFKRCYLPEGLPIIQSERDFSVDDVSVYEDEECTRPASCIDKKLIGQNIVRLSLNKETNKYQEFYVKVKIKVKDKVLDEQLSAIRIKGSNTINGENSIWYDSWGCASVTREENSILCDNSISYKNPDPHKIDNDKEYLKSCKNSLIPLLKSYAYARKETSRPYLLDRDISKIIHYVRLVEDWDIDEDEVGYLKYNLISLGVLSMATDNCGERRFELNNPRLVPIGNNKYLLYGAYTFSQYEEIKQSKEIASYDTKEVPDIYSELLVVELKKGVGDTICDIPVESQNFADVLLEKAQKMDITIFREVFMNAHEDAHNDQEGCVFRKPSKDLISNSIQEDGKIYARYLRQDKTYQQIPTSLQKLYVRRVNKKPLMMWDEETSTISFAWEMGIPYYVERALCILSQNVGVREKVFGLDGFLDTKKYKTITSFRVPDSQYVEKIYSILSNDEKRADGIMKYQKYKGTFSLFHRIKEEEDKSGIFDEYVLLKDNEVKLIVSKSYVDISVLECSGGKVHKVEAKGNVNNIITNYIEKKETKWVEGFERDMFITPEIIKNDYQELLIIKNR